jgi:thioredoxin 1
MSVKALNDSNFETEVLNAEETVLVDFFATWCGPCRIMSPVIDEIADENPSVKVCKVDVDEARDVAIKYGIMSIPTLMIFKNGEVTKSFIGVTDKEEINSAL